MDRQRIDKWLWHARVVRTRSAAAMLAVSGQVRVNGQRIAAASHTLRVGDVVTVALDRAVRVIKVQSFALRRGSAEDAQALFETIELFADQHRSPVQRDPGGGRPTKRERREIGRFTGK